MTTRSTIVGKEDSQHLASLGIKEIAAPPKRGQPRLGDKRLQLYAKAGPVLPNPPIFQENSQIWLLYENFYILKVSNSFKWKATTQQYYCNNRRKRNCEALVSYSWLTVWSFLQGCVTPWTIKTNAWDKCYFFNNSSLEEIVKRKKKTTKCSVVSGIGSWNRKKETPKTIVKSNRVWSSVSSIEPMLIS